MAQYKVIIGVMALVFCSSSMSYAKRSLINRLDYIPGKNISRLMLQYNGDAKIKVKYLKSTNQYILEIDGQEFQANLTKRLRVTKRVGPVSEITPYNVYGKTSKSRVLVQLREKARIISKKSRGKYYLCFTRSGRMGSFSCDAPMDRISTRSAVEMRAEEAARQLVETLSDPQGQRIYKGETVSLDSSDISVHDIFRLVGDASGLNIISSSGVKGNISLSVKDIPWDQLLDLVLQDKKLKITASGNVIRITTIDEFTAEQEKLRKLKAAQAEAEPIFMAIIPVSYAKASDIKTAIAALLQLGSSQVVEGGTTPTTTTSNASFSKGKIEVDVRTNSLLVTHTMEQIERVRSLVKELDVPSPQVLIESRIVSVADGYTKSLGINWGGLNIGSKLGIGFAINPSAQDTSGGGDAGGDAGGDTGDGGTGDGGGDPGDGGGDTGDGGTGDGGTTGGAGSSDITGDFKVEVSGDTPGGAFGVRLGTTSSNVSFNLEASELNEKAKIISSPRLLVSNKETASITDGQKIRITERNEDGVSQAYVDAVLSLQVTPQITNSGFVVLDITLNQDVPVGNASQIETKSLQTNVLVESGSTLVLGGVYSYNKNVNYGGVPILMDLPFIGPLFSNKSDVLRKTELLMFVTPRISDISSSVGIEDSENDGKSIL